MNADFKQDLLPILLLADKGLKSSPVISFCPGGEGQGTGWGCRGNTFTNVCVAFRQIGRGQRGFPAQNNLDVEVAYWGAMSPNPYVQVACSALFVDTFCFIQQKQSLSFSIPATAIRWIGERLDYSASMPAPHTYEFRSALPQPPASLRSSKRRPSSLSSWPACGPESSSLELNTQLHPCELLPPAEYRPPHPPPPVFSPILDTTGCDTIQCHLFCVCYYGFTRWARWQMENAFYLILQ